jgi:hypothetical protein
MTMASGESDARDAVTVRPAATSVEYCGGAACTTDGSVNSAELSSPDAVGADTPVDSVVGAGSWVDREDVAAAGSPLLSVCGSPSIRVEVLSSASACPVGSGCSWDLSLPADVTVGGVPLAVAGGPLSSLFAVLSDIITAPDVVVVEGKPLCVTCASEDSDKAESALCKTDKAFRDPVGSG